MFDVTVYAASTVLASFMGELAVGSYFAGRIAGRLRMPLRAFGFVVRASDGARPAMGGRRA